MPTIAFRLGDLERLTGIRRDDALRLLSRLKGEVESVTEDEVVMEVTHDRPDMFSVEGIARALKGLTRRELGLPRLNVVRGNLDVYVEDVPHRPYIRMAVVRDLELNDEAIRQMIQLQEKIHATYGRGRRKLAIGFYDYDLVRPPITYRLEHIDKVRYRPLGHAEVMNGREVLEKTEKGALYGAYALYGDKVPVLVDGEGEYLVIIPVLGSEDFKVTENTRNVLIDVTSTDEALADNIMAVLVYNLLERSRSRTVEIVRLVKGNSTVESPVLKTREFELTVEFVNEVSGLRLSRDEVVECLLMSRHDLIDYGDSFRVIVAPYRFNVLHPVDLVEDVLIAYGYDRIEGEFPSQPVKGLISPLSKFIRSIRDLMAGLGFQEVYNYMLTSKDVLVERVKWRRELVEVENPKSELHVAIRDHIWPQLVNVIARNKTLVKSGLKIFEVGPIARICGEGETGVCEDYVLAYLITGPNVTLTNGLSVLRALMNQLGIDYTLRHCEVPGGLRERMACITAGGEDMGFIMEVHPDVIMAFDLEYPIVVCELSITKLMGLL